MELFSCLVSFGAIILLLPAVENNPILCSWPVTLSEEEKLEVTGLVVPKTKAGKCLYECMLRSSGVVNEDAVIDVRKFMNKLKALIPTIKRKSLKFTEEVLEKCKAPEHLSADKCETTAKFLRCAEQESKIVGFEPTKIIKLIRDIHQAYLQKVNPYSVIRYQHIGLG